MVLIFFPVKHTFDLNRLNVKQCYCCKKNMLRILFNIITCSVPKHVLRYVFSMCLEHVYGMFRLRCLTKYLGMCSVFWL